MKIVLKKSFDEIVEKDWKYIQKYQDYEKFVLTKNIGKFVSIHP